MRQFLLSLLLFCTYAPATHAQKYWVMGQIIDD